MAWLFQILGALVAIPAVALGALLLIWGPTFTRRALLWGASSQDDWRRFPSRPVPAGGPVRPLPPAPATDAVDSALRAAARPDLLGRIGDPPRPGDPTLAAPDDVDVWLEATGTTAFLVLRNGALLTERYFGGYRRDSIQTSFSTAKSITSALIGIALARGLIASLDTPVAQYLPEFTGGGRERVTLRHLLLMASGFHYDHTKWGGAYVPWNDDVVNYYHPDLRRTAGRRRLASEPGSAYHYDNYNPPLLGMVLERVTGMSVAAFTAEALWGPMGAEADASWSLDRAGDGLEKMESGLNARARDFARFGQLFLDRGAGPTGLVISPAWVEDSTSPEGIPDRPDWYARAARKLAFAPGTGGFYKYQWWGYRRPADGPAGGGWGSWDFYAHGHLGQVIYVSPAAGLVFVRFGRRSGGLWWSDLFYRMAGTLAA